MTRSCTLCDVDMDARRRAGVEVDICANCMGLYLDAGEFDTVIGLQLDGRRYESTFDFVADDVANPRRCAGCAGPMRRAEFDGVRVDYCPGCGGVWIDGAARRELERRLSSDEVSRSSPLGSNARAAANWWRSGSAFAVGTNSGARPASSRATTPVPKRNSSAERR